MTGGSSATRRRIRVAALAAAGAAAALATGLALLVSGCATVPVTGRHQLSLIPASSLNSMSAQQYGQFLDKNPPSKDAANTELVRKVGRNIQGAVEKFMTKKKMSDRLQGYKWEFNLVESKEANAWCMPGGKVVVYSGILPITKDETGLAVVMGHEIAHAIAEHGSERMSQGLMAQFGGMALATAMSQKPAATQQLWMTAYGAGAQVGVLLPFSRLQESEADRLGLVFMAIAGYNPEAAVDFWKRMAEDKGKGGAPPELLSTHPSDATRVQKIREELPEAQKYYEKQLRKGGAAATTK